MNLRNKFTKRNFNKIVHVLQLNYKNQEATGLGDFFRGSFCLMQISKVLNIEFDIDISNHPISKYIKHTKNANNINYNDVYYYEKQNVGKNKHMVLNKNNIETNFDKDFVNDLIQWLNKKQRNTVALCCNAFPLTTHFTQQGIEYIKSKFIPNETLSEYIDNTLNELKLEKKRYDVIHIRSGDKFLINKEKMEYELLDKIKKIVSSIIYSETKYLIISDSNYIKQELQIFPNVHFIQKPIDHLASCKTNNGVMNTLLDFFLIGHSNSIVSLSTYEHESGFSKYSAIINKVPIKHIRIDWINKNELKMINQKNQKIAFITLTNTGYINYTLNCLKSLESIGFNSSLLHCYCIGKEGFEILKSNKYTCTLIDEEKNSNLQTFRTGNWSNIVYNKFKIIYENLLSHGYVCITDGDIVYEKSSFLKYLKEDILDNDMLIQNDTHEACSGFMFIKSNAKTLHLFNPSNVERYKNIKGWGDQKYINENKYKLKYKLLSLDLFPNGKYYYNNANSEFINPYLIHFNWIVGHEKENKMKYYKKWYVDENYRLATTSNSSAKL